MQEGTSEILVGFQIDERGIPRSGYLLYDSDENLIGRVTSGTVSLPQQRHRFGLCQNRFFQTRKKIICRD